jgi:hypothetical protein
MVDMGTAIIVSSFLTMIGLLVFSQLGLRNYFKKENFKISKSNIMAQNKLNLKKLEREMGLTPSKSPKEEKSGSVLDTLGALAPLIKNLEPDQIAGLIEAFIGGEGGAATGDFISNFVNENPELVNNFLEGLKGGINKGDNTGLGY